MDILVNNLFLLIAIVATAIAFIGYSVLTVRKQGARKYFRQLGKGSVFIFMLIGRFFAKVIGLLARSAKSPDEKNATSSSVRGGILNYRTGKLDDGTDPAGWYEKD